MEDKNLEREREREREREVEKGQPNTQADRKK